MNAGRADESGNRAIASGVDARQGIAEYRAGREGLELRSRIIPAMQKLRRAHRLAQWVFAWLAWSMAVAVASPIVKPAAMELVCSGAGVMKVLIETDDGAKEVSGPMLDCPLCATHAGVPPVVCSLTAAPAQPLAHVLQSIPAAHIASLTAAPLPARGPPFFL